MGKGKIGKAMPGRSQARGLSEAGEGVVQSGTPRLARKTSSKPTKEIGYAVLKQKKGKTLPKLNPYMPTPISTNLPSERVKSNTPQKSVGQIGKEMSKSGPRKNLRETAADVKGKLQKAYNKVTGRRTLSMEMDGKTFTGTERGSNRRFVTKVKNPESGSRKIVDVYTSTGNLKRQKIVDKFPSGKKVVTKSGPDADAIWQKEQTKLMRKKRG
jgi:hypothetical protein